MPRSACIGAVHGIGGVAGVDPLAEGGVVGSGDEPPPGVSGAAVGEVMGGAGGIWSGSGSAASAAISGRVRGDVRWGCRSRPGAARRCRCGGGDHCRRCPPAPAGSSGLPRRCRSAVPRAHQQRAPGRVGVLPVAAALFLPSGNSIGGRRPPGTRRQIEQASQRGPPRPLLAARPSLERRDRPAIAAYRGSRAALDAPESTSPPRQRGQSRRPGGTRDRDHPQQQIPTPIDAGRAERPPRRARAATTCPGRAGQHGAWYVSAHRGGHLPRQPAQFGFLAATA